MFLLQCTVLLINFFTILASTCPSSFLEPLKLTPHLEKGNHLEAQNLAQVSHPKFLGLESYSGYFTVNKQTDANLFFWYFPTQWNLDYSPVILWLQGNLGTSSLLGIFSELGPYQLVSETEIKLRSLSWHKRLNILFIDIPVGTGFSFNRNNTIINDQSTIGEQLHDAVVQFFKMFPKLQNLEFYIAGESFAGRFALTLGKSILQNNRANKNAKINLQGLMIGNSLLDPINQINYSENLYQLGLIDEIDQTNIAKQEKVCKLFLKQSNWTIAAKFLDKIHKMISRASGINNLHNYLNLVGPTSTESLTATFLNIREVQQALHVRNTPFHLVARHVNSHFNEDIVKSAAPWIAELLGHYRILIYHGQLDLSVLYSTVEDYLSKLDFDDKAEFMNATRQKWMVEGDLAGYYKRAGKLTEVLVRNAGHMVTRDQPIWALDLILRFIAKELV